MLRFEDAAQALHAEGVLGSARAGDGLSLFAIDNRGRSLFVMLTYPRDISDDFQYEVSGRRYTGLEKHVVFVAIKNGEHHGTGYLIDTRERAEGVPAPLPLAEMPDRVTRILATHGVA